MGAYNDDVLFIHIPKCGGTAAKEYMFRHLPDVKWPRTASWFARQAGRKDVTGADQARSDRAITDSKLPIGHVPLRDIVDFTGRPADSWERIIAVIRNPYEHQLSQWWFWRERYAKGDNHVHDMHAAAHPRLDSWLDTVDCDFYIWYEHSFHPGSELVRRPPSPATDYANWGGYFPYWFAINGKIPPNLVVLRQESLEHQFPLALAPWMDGVPPPMPRANETGHGPWREYYHKARSLEIVNAKFQWTFDNAKAYQKWEASESS